MKNFVRNIKKDNILFLSLYAAIAVSVLFLFAGTSNAVMPEYVLLQPITENLDSPSAAALDSSENIYITDTVKNTLNVYNYNGIHIKGLSGLNEPVSVAVGNDGRVYIGNRGSGNVEVYSPSLDLLFKLGKGDGEFKQPRAIALDSGNNIYVADGKANTVNVYNPDGTIKFSFGSYGGGDGEFTFPSSIAIDETAGELIISDLQALDSMYGTYSGARVQIFDMAGTFKRSFGEHGLGEGKLISPKGVAVDGLGRIYVSDTYQNVVQVFDGNGIYQGTIYDFGSPMRTPVGIALGKSNRLFVVSLIGSKVDIYGIDAYTDMSVNPLSLSYVVEEGASDPLPQGVAVNNTGLGILNWSALASNGWITLSSLSGSVPAGEASVLEVSVSAAGLTAGIYSGSVEIVAESGIAEVIDISLTVTAPPPSLSVTPPSLGFSSLNGSTPAPQTLTVHNVGGGTLDWNASADNGWIVLDKVSGAAPDTIDVSINITALAVGTYNGTVTVSIDGASVGSVIIPVSLEILQQQGAISVSTNLDEASFTLSGAASYAGGGTFWSVAEASAGTYYVIYGDVDGYITPSSESLNLTAGGSIDFRGIYEAERGPVVKRSIIVGAGPYRKNKAEVKVFNSDGSEVLASFVANGYKYGVNVASGDIDGDGIFEIITGAGPGKKNPAEVNVFDRNGNQMSGLSIIIAHSYNYGVNVASADMDGDGRYEIITGAGPGKDNPAEVKINIYDKATADLVDSGIELVAYDAGYGVRIAAGDVDGDGTPEIITAIGGESDDEDEKIVKIWKVDTSQGIGQWSAALYKEFNVPVNEGGISIAAGDINGDGIDEIIVGVDANKKGKKGKNDVKIYDSEGTLISEFAVSVSKKKGVNVASGDMDGDGVAEIVVGAGYKQGNRGMVKVFDASGLEKAGFKALNTKYGAGVAVGDFGE